MSETRAYTWAIQPGMVNEKKPEGSYTVTFDGSGLASIGRFPSWHCICICPIEIGAIGDLEFRSIESISHNEAHVFAFRADFKVFCYLVRAGPHRISE